ncbi:cytochrome P450 [Biscogniauxia marginata]|nr:cytochrome P450 [Biscogniauxia marginata]
MEIYTNIYKTMDAIKTSSTFAPANMDGPEDARQRAMLDDAFTPEVVEEMRLMIHGVVDRVLDEINQKYVETGKPFDLIEEFAVPVPMQIACKLLGIPEDDVGRLSSNDEQTLRAYVDKLVDARIGKSDREHGDLVSRLLREQYRKGVMSRDDIIELALLLLGSGNVALAHSIGLGVLTLFQHPEQWAKVRRNPLAWAPSVVDECLRYKTVSLSAPNSPGTPAAKKTTPAIQSDKIDRDLTTTTGAVQAGDWNRRRPSDPDKFDIHRNGYGPHVRESEHLMRIELEIALGTLFSRFPGLRFDAAVEDVMEWSPTQSGGISKLPVLVDTDAEMHRILIACD